MPARRGLDIAAGDGNASIPAAERGASVMASDLTSELLEAGRARAADASLDLSWQAASGVGFRDFVKRSCGPTIVAYRGVEDQSERVAELDAALAELGDRYRDGDLAQLEYLLTTGTVR